MKKKPSHLSRLSDMVSHAVANLPADQQRLMKVSTESVVELDPTHCRMNDLHRRVEINTADLKEFAESLKAVGQITPAKGWEIDNPDGEGKRYILVYGARRRAAAELAGLKLRVELIPEPSRKDLVRMMYGENSNRKDYSALERGLEFKAYMEAGEASSQQELADLLGEDRTSINRCLQVASLPQEVINAYPRLAMLTQTTGVKLTSEFEKDPAARDRAILAAVQWKQKGSEEDPTKALLAAAEGRDATRPTREHSVLKQKKAIWGRVSGIGSKDSAFTVQLRRGAPPELREDLLNVLRKHFPGFEG